MTIPTIGANVQRKNSYKNQVTDYEVQTLETETKFYITVQQHLKNEREKYH